MNVSEDISNHPELPEVRRRAFFVRLEVDHRVRSIVLHLVVKHYSAGMIPLKTLHDVPVRLIADNSTRVAANGDIIPRTVDSKPNPSWQSGIGEFDFLEQALINEGTLSSALYPIIRHYIILSDNRNRFDTSIYK